MVKNIRNFLLGLAYRLYYSDTARRAAHTFVQAFVAVLLVGLVSVKDFKTGAALFVAAVAAGISAVKGALVSRYGSEA